MSTPVSPVEHKLPQRSGTVTSAMTGVSRRTSMSDDEAIPGSDSNEVGDGNTFSTFPW